jgi:hypothetical protein
MAPSRPCTPPPDPATRPDWAQLGSKQNAGCWVAYNYDDRLAVIAVFADELSARRWAMDHYSPTTAVTYLPYGVDISEHLKRTE